MTFDPSGHPPAYVARTNDGGAVASLVLGILSLVMCGFLAGIPAIITGSSARKRIDGSGGRLDGRGMAVAGLIMGWVSVALTLVAVVIVVAVFAFGSNVSTQFNSTCNTVDSTGSC